MQETISNEDFKVAAGRLPTWVDYVTYITRGKSFLKAVFEDEKNEEIL